MTDILSNAKVCIDHQCPECGVREHVTVERVIIGNRIVNRCHCRVCGHSWHPEESAA